METLPLPPSLTGLRDEVNKGGNLVLRETIYVSLPRLFIHVTTQYLLYRQQSLPAGDD